MPDNKPVHYRTKAGAQAPTIACGAHPLRIAWATPDPGRVTCFGCRRTEVFKAEQLEGVEPPTPSFLARQMGQQEPYITAAEALGSDGVGAPTPPVKLSGVMAEVPEIQVLDRAALRHVVKRGLNAGTNDAEHEALTELADALGLVYDDDTESYQ